MNSDSFNVSIGRFFNYFDKVETSGVDCQCAWLAFNNALKLNGLSITLPIKDNLIDRKQVIDDSNIFKNLTENQTGNVEGLLEMDYENDFQRGYLTDTSVYLYMISYIFEKFHVNVAVTIITNPVKYIRYELTKYVGRLPAPIELTIYHNLAHFSNVISKDKRRFRIKIEANLSLTVNFVCEFSNCTLDASSICCQRHDYFQNICYSYREKMDKRLEDIQKHNEVLIKILEEKLRSDQQYHEDYMLALSLSEEEDKVISAYDTIIEHHKKIPENKISFPTFDGRSSLKVAELEKEKTIESARMFNDRLLAFKIMEEDRNQIENDWKLALEMSKSN